MVWVLCLIARPPSRHPQGANAAGQLGDGTTTARTSPTQVNNTALWSWVAVGSSFSCGIQAANSYLYCWGLGSSGQLGRGSTH